MENVKVYLDNERVNEIKVLLYIRNFSYADISRKTGLGYHNVQKVLRGLRESPKVRAKIAKFLKIDYSVLWDNENDSLKKIIDAEKKERFQELSEVFLPLEIKRYVRHDHNGRKKEPLLKRLWKACLREIKR